METIAEDLVSKTTEYDAVDNNCNGTPDYREDYDNDGQIDLLDDVDYDGTADYLE